MSLARLLEQATPGPWEHRVWGTDAGEWPDSRVSVGTVRGHGEAVVINPRYGKRAQDLANARLVALAPDMAQLLIDMAAWAMSVRDEALLDCEPDYLVMDALLTRFAVLDGQAKDTT